MRKIIIAALLLLSAWTSINGQAQAPTARLAFAGLYGTRTLYVWDGQTVSIIGQGLPSFYAPAWSNDGRLVFLSGTEGNQKVFVWDGTEAVQIAQLAQPNYGEPIWSSDGRLAFVSSQSGTRRVQVWDGENTIDVLPEAYSSGYPTWSNDGRLAFEAFINDQNDVFIWDGATVTNVSQHEAWDDDPAWSSDGRLAFVSYRDDTDPNDSNREVYIWDNGTLTNISQSVEDNYGGFVWSPDGQQLAFRAEGELLLLWNGTEVITLGEMESYYPPAWSPDGRLTFVRGLGDLMIWDGETLTQMASVGGETPFTWSIDGRLAFGTTRVQNTEMGEFTITQVTVWDNGTTTLLGDGYGAAWAADGRLAFLRNDFIGGDTDSTNDVLVWDGESEIVVYSEPDIFGYLLWEPEQAR